VIVRYVLIPLWLGAAAGAASALTVGAARGGVVLGRPVDVAVEVTPDPGKALADSCIAAEVLTGDRPLSRVRVLPLPEVPGRTPLVRIQTAIFSPSCATQFCHDAATASGNLVLTDTTVSYDNLVGVTPDNRVARDRGLLRVVPDDPAMSFLIVKVTRPALGEGSRMPLGQDPLTAEQIALLTGWIEAGAPAN